MISSWIGVRLCKESGFTLVEVLVTVMLMTMVMLALYSMFDMSVRVFKTGNSSVEANQNARIAVDRMEREIRSAWPSIDSCSDPTSSPGQLVSGDTTSISFRNCFNQSGIPTSITYSVTDDWLTRNGVKLARVGSANPLTLGYCTSSCSSSPSSTTELVQITLTVRNGDRTQKLVTSAGLRNPS